MIEPNLLNPKQGIGLPGASEKLQKGKTGKEPKQIMPFACIIEHALNTSHGKGKMCGPFNKGSANKQKGQHSAIPGSEAKNINAAGLFSTIASKDKGVKTSGSIPGKIDLLSKRDGQKQTEGKVENLPESTGIKKSKPGINNALMEDVRGALKPGLNKQSIESVLPESGLTGMVVGKDKAQVCVNPPEPFGGLIGPFGKRAPHSGMRNGKNATALFKDGKNATAVFRDVGLKKSGSRSDFREIKDAPEVLKFSLKNAVAVKGKAAAEENFRNGKNDTALFKDGKNATAVFRDVGLKKSGSRSDFREIKDAPEVLKFSLKNAVAVKGKSAVEPDKTGKNPFTPIKDDSGKNGIKNLLKRSMPSRSPLHSIDKISSAGAYHHTSFHSGGSSAVINENVNSHGIEPGALIDQIASGVKRPGRVRITLNPPRLGTLDVDVLVRDNKVHVILQAENNDVRQTLQSNVESLKSSLRNHGLVADTINVSVQEKSDGSNYGADYKPGQNETLFKEGGNREGNEEDQGGWQDSVNHDPTLLEEENQRVRSDGRISLFA